MSKKYGTTWESQLKIVLHVLHSWKKYAIINVSSINKASVWWRQESQTKFRFVYWDRDKNQFCLVLLNPPVNPWTSNVKKNSEGRPNVSKWFYYSANSWVPSLEELLYLILVCPFFSNRLKRVLGSQDDILVQLLCCGARCWVHSLWGSFEGKSTRKPWKT